MFILIISSLISALIAILIVDYTYKRTIEIECKRYFELLFHEISIIFQKGSTIFTQIDNLKPEWINCDTGKWIQKKHPKPIVVPSNDMFFYQFFPNNIFVSLSSKGYDENIKGFDPSSNDDHYHQLSKFYLLCYYANVHSQGIENEINVLINWINATYHSNFPIQTLKVRRNNNILELFEATNPTIIIGYTRISKIIFLTPGSDVFWQEYVTKRCEDLKAVFTKWKSDVTTEMNLIINYPSLTPLKMYEDLTSTINVTHKNAYIGKFIIILIFAILTALLWTVVLISKVFLKLVNGQFCYVTVYNPYEHLIFSGIISFIIVVIISYFFIRWWRKTEKE